MLKNYKKGSAVSTEIFTTLLRLRQICCHPQLLPDFPGDKNFPSAKMELLHELLHENIDSSHKMLLFSQFTSLLQLIIPELDKEGIPFEYLDGGTVDRMKRVDNFNKSPDIPLFLLSLKAGGTGLNLTSADTVIIYDPWWNPAVELQAADRSHRIGQQNPVTICRLVVRNSVEEKILALQGRKRKLFDAVVEASSSGSGLSLEELSFLIENN
jgi:non-specific serine/threonine protein kinase